MMRDKINFVGSPYEIKKKYTSRDKNINIIIFVILLYLTIYTRILVGT